ncbi:MAG: division/cell wall cluster transcriptional repressor MraZ [Deltaproteobacteria bacterium]|nr:division/cell wall cluster transcriptional repressor MraZ [Deltaproteobacteria bacterium]
MEFNGQFIHTLDAKGRLNTPTRFKEAIKDSPEELFVLTKGAKCIVAYPYETWQTILKQAATLDTSRKNVKRYIRFFISAAQECNLDKAGRILIPQTLREHAGLDKDILLAGMLSHFEIWDKARWDEDMAEIEKDFEDISEEVGQMFEDTGPSPVH